MPKRMDDVPSEPRGDIPPRSAGETLGSLLRSWTPAEGEIDVYRVETAWARTLEIVSDIPESTSCQTSFAVPDGTSFLLEATTTPNGQPLPPSSQGPHVAIQNHRGEDPFVKTNDTETVFAHLVAERLRLGILAKPLIGEWKIQITSRTQTPFAVHIATLHVEKLRAVSGNEAPPARLRCRACKATSKALGASIIVAATLPALPNALLSVVAAYLGGVKTAVASAFILSLCNQTVDAAAQKLCKVVRMC